MGKCRVLVCDDDKQIVEGISIYLQHEGYEVFKAYNGEEALQLLNKQDVELIIMDVMMPKLDGLQATMKIRQDKNLPIIILSAKSEDTDKITGLNFGADDYVTKPFSPLELMARVKSQLRRYQVLGSEERRTSTYTSGGLTINTETKEVEVEGELIHLTATEYNILKLLLENKGRVFSTTEIYEKVWGEDSHAVDNTVSVHIRRMREKVEVNPKNPQYIKVVWGIGYKVENYDK